jgi:hypothetical protein
LDGTGRFATDEIDNAFAQHRRWLAVLNHERQDRDGTTQLCQGLGMLAAAADVFVNLGCKVRGQRIKRSRSE